jgi:hypothetical protein
MSNSADFLSHGIIIWSSSQLFEWRRSSLRPLFSGYNLREAPTPKFSGYNQKEATTPYVLWLQPEGGYNHLSLPHPTTLKYKFQM